MPQNGFHGLVGLAVARSVAPRVAKNVSPGELAALVGGITLGAMLPDVDMYPTAIAFLSGHGNWVYAIHRTFTHSLLALALVLAAAMALLRRGGNAQPPDEADHETADRREPGHPQNHAMWWCAGIGLGMATHELLDIFFWFAPLDLFWPFSHVPPGHPLFPVIDLWKNVRLPALAGNPDAIFNLRDAGEFAAFGLYLLGLQRASTTEAEAASTDALAQSAGLGRWQLGCWLLFALATAAAFFLPSKREQVLVNVPVLLLLMPFCWIQTVKRRDLITRWCLKSTGK